MAHKVMLPRHARPWRILNKLYWLQAMTLTR